MTIKHCIIHKVERAQPGANLSIKLKPEEHPLEGPMASLFEQLKMTFTRNAQKQYGLFDPDISDNPMPAGLKELEEEKSSFISFTHRVMNHLKQQLDAMNDAFSGHILFVVETLMEQDFFYCFWVNHSDATKIGGDLQTEPLEFINTSKLTYAFKIDIEQWKVDGWDQYFSLIAAKGNKDLAAAFLKFSGFISSVDLKEQTEQFLEVVDQYTESLEAPMAKQLKSKIVEYCIDQDTSGSPIDIKDLSSQLDEEQPEHFSNFVNENQPESRNEIFTDRASLKKYVRFFGRDKNLSISFSSDMYGEEIIYDAQTGSLTFKQIPKSLKAQLAKYLNNSED
ncbi:nucleoid-associated protein [Pleionea sp. CnH1-48]|uniref:nucleoid-associated protein n=1 Tax=Pleionea sp. CnH1-48 TaxID=2954494 RepID=UPI00209740E1|nr:nucleoid-associated protein [Pleionea sp. CnH1-48]MCO7226712.1 nucleoid-associated protein [Pleionea sp. CnH1-48]